VRCGFGFYLIWTQNLFLNGFGNKFNWEKKKKKLTYCRGLEACLSRPVPPSLTVGPTEPSPFLRFSPTPAWAGPGAVADARILSLASLTSGPRLSVAIFFLTS
jgi:hypothetical protein